VNWPDPIRPGPAFINPQALMDMKKPPELISTNMTLGEPIVAAAWNAACPLATPSASTFSCLRTIAVLAGYSAVFMRFAWMVQPRNYLLLYCHVCNEAAQLTQLGRKLTYEASTSKGKLPAGASTGAAAGAVDAVAAAASAAPPLSGGPATKPLR